MLKIAFVALATLAVVAANIIPATSGNAEVKVQVLTPQEMSEFLKRNPQAQPLNREVVSKESTFAGQARLLVTYTIGARQSGDGIVAYDSGYNSWDRPNDVVLTINYPSGSGFGSVVTYMRIEVNQSNDLGKAYIISGGLGYRYISVIVEAVSTEWFNWVHNIYGI